MAATAAAATAADLAAQAPEKADDAAVTGLAVAHCTLLPASSAAAHLFNHLDPEPERQIITLWIPQLPAQLVAVSLLEDCDIKSWALGKSSDVLAIVILVATKFRQSQVVSLEDSDPQVLELSGIHINQSLFVPLGNISAAR